MDTEAEHTLRERLAALAHEQWTHWMTYLCAHCTKDDQGRWAMDQEHALRWQRQMHTPYSRLSEHEKDADRAEADRVLALLKEVGR